MDFLGAGIGAVIGHVADSYGQQLNQAVNDAVDPDNKAGGPDKGGLDFEAIIAPVQQEMRDTFPGLELLMLPDQKHLVLHQKVEAAELLSDMTNFGLAMADFPIGVPNVETPNTYAIRDRDTSVTYYLIEEMSNGWEGFCCRDQCRRNMPMKFAVKNMRTQRVVARIDSPMACDPCCCGCYWCILPVPVCCCSRQATWYEVGPPPGGPTDISNEDLYTVEPIRAIASASHGCTTSDCGCAWQINAQTADGSVQFQLFKRFCCCSSKGCFGFAELMSDWNIVDEQHDWKAPLGRTWTSNWKTDYIPTHEQYPPLPEQGTGSLMKNLVKDLGKELFTDADTSLLECPHEGADAKAALITAALVSDYFYREE